MNKWFVMAVVTAAMGVSALAEVVVRFDVASVTNAVNENSAFDLNTAVPEFIEVPLTSTKLYVQGAKYAHIDGNGMNFERFDFSKTLSNADATRAKTTSGVTLSFYSRSDTINLYFDYVVGDEYRNSSKFTTYQNGEYVSTPAFSSADPVEGATQFVMQLVSTGSPGDLVRHDVVLPNWANPILSKMELKFGEVLEAGNPFKDEQIIFLGDSISHGTGQDTTAEGYPYLVAEALDRELFNLAVGGAEIAPEIADMLQDFEPVEAIWVLVGYNDWQGGSDTVEEITTEYEALLATIRLRQPDAEVFCCTLVATTVADDVESGVTVAEVRQAVSTVVNARIAAGDDKLHLVDGDSISSSDPLYTRNSKVHFTPLGAADFATQVVSILDPILNPLDLSVLAAMVAEWKFDDASGTTAADSVGSYDGTMVKDTEWVLNGVSGGALNFANTNIVTLPAAAFGSLSNEVTVSMWVFGEDSQPVADECFYTQDSATNKILNIHVPWQNGKILFDAGNGGEALLYDRVLQDGVSSYHYKGRWNHWVFTKNAATGVMSMYVNGEFVTSATDKFYTLEGAVSAYIGGFVWGAYQGLMDEVRLYDTALSGAEVSSLFDSYNYTLENVLPIANPQSVTTLPNIPVDITLVGMDPEGSNITYSVVDVPTNGTIMATTNSAIFTYTPSLDFSGFDSFTFKVNDGEDDSAPATVSITVTNELPTADSQSVQTDPNGSVEITLTGTDPEGSDLTYSVVDAPTNGSLSVITGATLTYTPNLDFEGDDSFTFKVNDGLDDSAPATVSISVALLLPTADSQVVQTEPETAKAITLTGTDPAGSGLTYSVIDGPSKGSLSVITGATLTYTPDTGFVGEDSFTFTVNDGVHESDPATVSINVATAMTVSFNDLSIHLTDELNTLIAAGAGTAFVTGAADGINPDFLYSVSMTDYDFDGDALPDSLTFDMRVSSVAEGTIAQNGLGASSATIGTTVQDTVINTTKEIWFSGVSDTRMSAGESLVFSIENVSLIGTAPGNLSYVFDGFSGAWLKERGMSGHSGVLGSGTGLNGYLFNGNQEATLAGDSLDKVLFVSSTTAPASTAGNWGVGNVDFQLSIFQEPVEAVLEDFSIEVVSGGTELAMSWLTDAVSTYGVEARSSLVSGTWTNIISNVLGTGGVVTEIYPITEDTKFYRAYIEE